MSKLSLILKSVCWTILLVVTIIGCVGHFQSITKDAFDEIPDFKKLCKFISDNSDIDCPHNAMDLERVFVAFAIIILILSSVSILAEILLKDSKFKFIDAGFHGLAGLLLIIAGACMLAAAIRFDKFVNDPVGSINSRSGIAGQSDLQQLLAGFSHQRSRQSNPGIDFTKESREAMKYPHKLAAGSLAILNALLYFLTAAVLARG